MRITGRLTDLNPLSPVDWWLWLKIKKLNVENFFEDAFMSSNDNRSERELLRLWLARLAGVEKEIYGERR